MKKFTRIAAVLTALAIILVCFVSCSNSSGGGGGDTVLSTWDGSGAGDGITFTVYSGNVAKVTAPRSTWEATYTGDIDAASGKITIIITKVVSGSGYVNKGDVFIGTKKSATTLVLTKDGTNFGTYTKR